MAVTAKEKQKTRDELLKLCARTEAETSLLRDHLLLERRKNEKLETTVTELRGIIAELEREKALLQGYIERGIQEEQKAIGAVEPTREDMYESSPMPQRTPAPVKANPFKMPQLRSESAGIDETTNSSYGSSTKRKPWYKL